MKTKTCGQCKWFERANDSNGKQYGFGRCCAPLPAYILASEGRLDCWVPEVMFKVYAEECELFEPENEVKHED